MVFATQNQAKENKTLNKMLPEHVDENAETIAARLYTPIRTLSSISVKAPLLGESNRKLAVHKINRSGWSSTIFRTMNLPSISDTLGYILKRAAFVPSVLYRKINLPLFRKKRMPRLDSTQSIETFLNSQPYATNARMDKLLDDGLLRYSDIKAEEEQKTEISVKAHPAIIKNLFSPPVTVNRIVNMRHEPGVIDANNLKTSIVTPSEITGQHNAADDLRTFYDKRGKSPVSETLQPKVSQPIFKKLERTDLNQSTTSVPHSRNATANQVSSQTTEILTKQISRQQETSKRNKTDNSVQENPDISMQESPPPRTTNIQEKQVITPDGQAKPHSFTNNSDAHISEELLHSDTGLSQITGSEQVTMSKGQPLSDKISKHSMPVINKADIRKPEQSSISETPGKLPEKSSKESPKKNVELYKEISDDYVADVPPVSSVTNSTSLKSEATLDTLSEKKEILADKTISGIANQSSIQLIPEKYNTWPSASLPLQKTEASAVLVEDYNGESRPKTDPMKSVSAKSNTSQNIVPQQNASIINKAVSKKSDQTSHQGMPGNPIDQSINPGKDDYEVNLPIGINIIKQVTDIKRPQTGKSTMSQSNEYIQRTNEIVTAPEDSNSLIYEHDNTNIDILPTSRKNEDTAGINVNHPQISRPRFSDSLNAKMKPVIGNTSNRITLVSQRILRAKINKSASETNGKDFVISNIEDISPSPGYFRASQQSLNLPVASQVQAKADPGIDRSDDLFRTVSDTIPEMIQPKSYTTPDMALVPVVRKAEPASIDQMIVNQPQNNNKNDQAVAPNIRTIADQVYTLLRRELKIERERERHRLLR